MIKDDILKKLHEDFPGYKFRLIQSENDASYSILCNRKILRVRFNPGIGSDLKGLFQINLEAEIYSLIKEEVEKELDSITS